METSQLTPKSHSFLTSYVTSTAKFARVSFPFTIFRVAVPATTGREVVAEVSRGTTLIFSPNSLHLPLYITELIEIFYNTAPLVRERDKKEIKSTGPRVLPCGTPPAASHKLRR